MLRRNSGFGLALLAFAAVLLFLPFLAASTDNRPTQTATVLALLCALVSVGLTWLLLRPRGGVRASYLGLAALAGGFETLLLLDFVPGIVGGGALPAELVWNVVEIALVNAAALWLFAVALRIAFPRQVRGMAAAAAALLIFGLFPAPVLLLQLGTATANINDVEPQVRAGYLYWTVGAVLLVGPFLALTTLPGDWFERWWAAASSRLMAVPRLTFAVATVVVALALAIFFANYSFARRPTTADEIAQLWHARMLLHGHLAMPPDANPEFFAIDNVVDRPRWMSQFPIGGPAMLAVGQGLGLAWLLNPILTALTTLNVYRFTQRAYGEAQARVAAAVFVTSPMVLLLGATHMNHTPTAWLVTLALATLPLWTAATTPKQMLRFAAVIGGAVGVAITIRPLDGVIAGAVIGLVMLAVAARERVRASSLLIAIGAGAVPLALLLLANWKTTGHPLRFGYELLWGSNHSIGLHDDPTGNPHTPWRALMLGIKYAVQLNWTATGWPIPVLLIVAAGLALARRPRRWDVILLAYFGAQLLVHAFYWHDGQFVGPRFLFTAVPALLILAARAPFMIADRAREAGVWRRIAIVAIPVCIGVTWLRSMKPFGVQGLAGEFRATRARFKFEPPGEVKSGAVRYALIFVQEGASARVLHRLWGVGVSRPDAGRLLAYADGCSLLEAVRAEERRPLADSAGRVRRIEQSVRPFRRSSGSLPVSDRNFNVTDTTSVTRACADEIARDLRLKNAVAFGSMLLLNRFDASGRIGGPVVYAMDLGERNDVLRPRFGDRTWYRYEIPRNRPGDVPVLVPYDSPR